jgi:hypothetical protein
MYVWHGRPARGRLGFETDVVFGLKNQVPMPGLSKSIYRGQCAIRPRARRPCHEISVTTEGLQTLPVFPQYPRFIGRMDDGSSRRKQRQFHG